MQQVFRSNILGIKEHIYSYIKRVLFCVLNAFYFFEGSKNEESNTAYIYIYIYIYIFCKNSRMAFFNLRASHIPVQNSNSKYHQQDEITNNLKGTSKM